MQYGMQTRILQVFRELILTPCLSMGSLYLVNYRSLEKKLDLQVSGLGMVGPPVLGSPKP